MGRTKGSKNISTITSRHVAPALAYSVFVLITMLSVPLLWRFKATSKLCWPPLPLFLPKIFSVNLALQLTYVHNNSFFSSVISIYTDKSPNFLERKGFILFKFHLYNK